MIEEEHEVSVVTASGMTMEAMAVTKVMPWLMTDYHPCLHSQ